MTYDLHYSRSEGYRCAWLGFWRLTGPEHQHCSASELLKKAEQVLFDKRVKWPPGFDAMVTEFHRLGIEIMDRVVIGRRRCN